MTNAMQIRLLVAGVGVSVMFLGQPPLQAQTRDDVVLWGSIKDSNRPSDFLAYLDKYPHGTFALIAKRQIVDLTIIRFRTHAVVPPFSSKEAAASFRTCQDYESLTSSTHLLLSFKMFVLMFSYANAKRGDRLAIEWSSPRAQRTVPYILTNDSPDCDVGVAAYDFRHDTTQPPAGEWQVTMRVNGIEFFTIPFTVSEK